MRRVGRICCAYLKNRNELFNNSSRNLVTSGLRTTPCIQQLEWEPTNFYNLASSQKRGYVPDTTSAVNKCWNCKKDTSEAMLCEHCNHLQDAKTDVNYFDLLDFPQSFALEVPALTKRFRQLQSLVHPDKFSNKSSREQANSADWSSLINKAYKTLSVPIERGQYLLQLHGLQIPQDNSALNKEFLMDMMERNEEVDEADGKKELEEIYERLSQELHDKVDNLTKCFASNNLDAAISVMVEMKYLLSIQKTVKNKLQSLMGS